MQSIRPNPHLECPDSCHPSSILERQQVILWTNSELQPTEGHTTKQQPSGDMESEEDVHLHLGLIYIYIISWQHILSLQGLRPMGQYRAIRHYSSSCNLILPEVNGLPIVAPIAPTCYLLLQQEKHYQDFNSQVTIAKITIKSRSNQPPQH